MLTINKTIEDGKAVFTLEGRLDTTTAPMLEKELKEALPGVSDLTLDFADLEYISLGRTARAARGAEDHEPAGPDEDRPRERDRA